jgi:hypothetical protein
MALAPVFFGPLLLSNNQGLKSAVTAIRICKKKANKLLEF